MYGERITDPRRKKKLLVFETGQKNRTSIFFFFLNFSFSWKNWTGNSSRIINRQTKVQTDKTNSKTCCNGNTVPQCQIFLDTTYQNWAIQTKWPQNLPKCHKIHQMANKFTKIFHYKAFRNIPKFGFFVWKHTIWQPCTMPPDIQVHVDRWEYYIPNWLIKANVGTNPACSDCWLHNSSQGQGCQIFLGPNIPKRKKYTKWPQIMPNGHVLYQMIINHNKRP
jgi:hypothetical protein